MTLLVKNRLLAFAGKFLIFLSLCCCGNANFAVAQSLSGQTPQQTNTSQNTAPAKTPQNNITQNTNASNLPAVGTSEYKLEAEKGLLFKTCGEQYPYGCPDGSKCYRVTQQTSSAYVASTGGWGASSSSQKQIYSWECVKDGTEIPKHEKDGDPIYELREEGSLGMGTITRKNFSNVAGDQGTETVCDSSGKCVTYNDSNATCEIGRMKLKYQTNCYSCLVVKTLLSEFMKIGDKTYSLCRDAAVKILFLCSALWIAFFVLKNVSSLTSIEPASFVNQLLSQLFKIVVAYAIIVSGADTFITYVVNPIMDAGADYGLGIIQAAEQSISTSPDAQYAYDQGSSLLSKDVLNKILALNQGIDRIVSTNLVIGHGLTCHATHAGVWTITIGFFTLHIVNLWIWLCGAIIWFLGFMMTLSIAYYLVDIAFKIGIAIIIFPITIALWPFSLTKDRVKACISTIFMSAATFAFLALTASYATLLISASLRDISTLETKLSDGDTQWISDTFDVTGPYFLIILFAFLYSLKLIEATIPSYVSLFFSGGIAAKLTPIHKELTRVTDVAKKSAIGTGKYVKDVATHQGSRATKGIASTLGKINPVRFANLQQQDAGQNSSQQSAAGQATQMAGATLKNSGKAVEATGKATKTAGKGMEIAGKGMDAAGKGMSKAGASLSSSGIGAIVGVPLKAVGIATQAAGKATESAGKNVKTAGENIEKTGKTMKNTGKKMEEKGKDMKKDKSSPNNNQNNDKNKNNNKNNDKTEEANNKK